MRGVEEHPETCDGGKGAEREESYQKKGRLFVGEGWAGALYWQREFR